MAYNDQNNNYKPTPFSVTRDSIATRVNKQGLIEVVGKDKLRIDYTDSTKGVALLEPARTNSSTYSEDFSNSIWSRTNSTVSINQTVAPDGTATADRFIESTATGSHDIRQNESGLSSGTQYTYSIFVKEYEGGSYRNVFFYVGGINSIGTFSFSTGTFTSHSFDSAKAINYGNGWYRLEITDTTVGTTFNTIIIAENGTTTSYTGDGTSGFYLWGSQFEQGSYATSYIPTSGSTYQRQADEANGAGNSEVFNDSEGVLFADIAALANDGTSRRISISDGNRVSLEVDETANKIVGIIFSGGSSQASMEYTSNNILLYSKISVKYKANDFSIWFNGFKVVTDTSGIVPSGLSELAFDDGNRGSDFYGKAKEIGVYDAVLTDAELEALTSYTSFTNMANELNLTIK
jgi:hypothetical protein